MSIRSLLIAAAVLPAMSAFAAEPTMPAAPSATATTVPSTTGMMNQAKGAAAQAGQKVMVNLNTATAEDLQKVPGVTPANAQEIIKMRPYKSVTDLSKVKGLKQDMIAKIKPYVSVN